MKKQGIIIYATEYARKNGNNKQEKKIKKQHCQSCEINEIRRVKTEDGTFDVEEIKVTK
jgi:hypothetical protein